MLISRRTALVRGATALAGLYFAASAQATTTGMAYELKITAHCNCKACHHHAANKLFATRAAAQNHRAHPGCKCTVVQTRLDEATWVALFGPARHPARTAVDRRWAATKRELKRVAQTASHKPTANPTPTHKTTTHKPAVHPTRKRIERRSHASVKRRHRAAARS
jgi:hypothetical protein